MKNKNISAYAAKSAQAEILDAGVRQKNQRRYRNDGSGKQANKEPEPPHLFAMCVNVFTALLKDVMQSFLIVRVVAVLFRKM